MSTLYLQTLISGLMMGSIYCLIALGIVLLFKSSNLLDIAHGEYAMISGLLMVFFVEIGLPWYFALPLVIIITSALSGIIFKQLLIPAAAKSKVIPLLITVALIFVFQGISFVIWGPNPHSLPAFFGTNPIKIGQAVILPQAIGVLAITFILLAVIYYVLERTKMGRTIRAISENEYVAGLMGINPRQIWILTAIFKGGIAAVAGALIIPITMMNFDSGLILTLKGVAAAIIGGLNKVHGAIVGGLLLGLVESFGAIFILGTLKDSIGLTLLILILLVRPQGIFGGISR